MALSPSNNYLVNLQGLMRSGHSLVGLVCLVSMTVCLTAMLTGYAGIAVGSASIIGVIVLGVVGRYVLKGPEAEKASPSVTIADNRVSLINIDPASLPELRRLARMLRQPLPAPSGIIKGIAADPMSVIDLTPEQAEEMRQQDLAEDDDETSAVGATTP
jgi:hypothetical protein